MFKLVLAFAATVSAKECYEAVGTFDLEAGSVDAEMNVCWPKTSDNGALATGVGKYDDGSKKGQALTITHAWVAADSVLTLWIKEKIGKTTNLCSIMCELDDAAVCSGYFSCQPNAVGTVSFQFALPEPEEEEEEEEEPAPAPKAKGKKI